MKSDRKPPLAKSPMKLRGRRPLRPTNTNNPLLTPVTKTQTKESENRPEYHTAASCELRALAKMVQDELSAINAKNNEFGSYASSIGGSNLFERGRYYQVYSERRNERLRKKQNESGDDEPKTAYNLGVKVDCSTKKKDSRKKSESLKKSIMAVNYSADRSQHPRYSLRSTTKKPPLPVPMYVEETTTARKGPSLRTRRK
ncbi:hypothetical protein BVRB_1g021150 isoform A [Beta vulgaris subsp. vulgaris]|uniref:uncharacterized protein LOC104905654 isoform X2 n=1 Tax=Beta vulgaris subsp. vulgaris TaxID=3555 RepID=UPI00053F6604|nr:uncharacterized protein LOC104905654 isoform X2 [Beta vulgaris subsp. vulgaris]KMS99749.1 hypothetical protein BVRB_1g021150 isoform A [Beta vulgaris subsp. vulgaris]